MSFLDMVAKAKRFAKREGEFIKGEQRGTLMIKGWTSHKGQSGPYTVLLGDLVEVHPKITGGVTQAKGSELKLMHCMYGSVKRIQAQQADLLNCIIEVSGCSEEEAGSVMKEIFGDSEDGTSEGASKDAKERPTFGARGMLVDFDAKNTDKKDANGEPFVRVRLINKKQGNSDDEILARQKDLSAVA